MKPWIAAVVALAMVGPACSQPAGGGGGGDRRQVRQACQADMQRLCADSGPGRARFQCIRQHHDELSDACKAALASAHANRHHSDAPSDEGSSPPS